MRRIFAIAVLLTFFFSVLFELSAGDKRGDSDGRERHKKLSASEKRKMLAAERKIIKLLEDIENVILDLKRVDHHMISEEYWRFDFIMDRIKKAAVTTFMVDSMASDSTALESVRK